MGYRQYHRDEPKPQRSMQKLTTPSDFYVHLGTVGSFAIPCWYLEQKQPYPSKPHRRDKHDHYGWPTPDYPDASCQSYDFADTCLVDTHNHTHAHFSGICRDLLNMGNVFPIHLTQEGYTDIEVHTEFKEGDDRIRLTGEAAIDENDDWIIRIGLESSAQRALTNSEPYKPAKFLLSVFASNGNDQPLMQRKKDLVCLAIVEVLPTVL